MSDTRETLIRDMAEMHWPELKRFAPEGSLVYVGPELELITVAEQFAADNKEQVQRWMESGSLRRAEDEDTEKWAQSTSKFLCVIVQPFVLMQEIATQA